MTESNRNETDLISVIVPVYKVEQYLDRCMESLVNQTYQNLEIILVDDGSPDRCPALCDRWAQQDARIRVIHKPNGGVSSARNAGLGAARGQWIFFADSDDFVTETALECLMSLQKESQADLVCGSIHVIKRGNKSFDRTYPEKVMLQEDFAENLPFLVNELHESVWGKLIRTKIIKEYGLAFPVGMPRGEDATFSYRYLSHASAVVTTSKCVYHYDMIREDSAVKRYYENINGLARQLFDVQKEFIASIGGEQTALIRELEQKHFTTSLCHYALYETNRNKLAEKIREAAQLFPDAVNHERYGEAVRNQQWLRAVWQWRRDNFKWYLKEVLKRSGLLFR